MMVSFNFTEGSRKYLMGSDLSHHNFEFVKNIINPAGLDFVFLKVSEGLTYKDPKCAELMSVIGNNMDTRVPPYMGFYHYAHAEYTEPEDEARFFLQTLKELNVANNVMYALDLEGDSFTNPEIDEWAYKFLSYVENETTRVPFIYTPSSMTGKFPVTAEDYPLWLAHYKKKSMESPRWWNFWKEPKIWQFTTIPYDLDMAFMSRDDLHLWCTLGRETLKELKFL